MGDSDPCALQLLSWLRKLRLCSASEAHLQDALEEALQGAGIEFERERQLSKTDRIDFYLPKMRLGIECKISGSNTAVTRQLLRYAGHETIDSLLLVTTRWRMGSLPRMLGGKPLAIHVQVGI